MYSDRKDNRWQRLWELKMAKKGTLSWWKKKVDIKFNKFIRLRDLECQHCGETKNLHASHTVPKSHGLRFRYDERNVIALCYRCHLNWWHKNPIDAAQWFMKAFPLNDKYLKDAMSERLKYTIPELEDLYKKYSKKVKELEE